MQLCSFISRLEESLLQEQYCKATQPLRKEIQKQRHLIEKFVSFDQLRANEITEQAKEWN